MSAVTVYIVTMRTRVIIDTKVTTNNNNNNDST